ncbi:MAG: hypothetical protein HZA93_22065 [Verrucomicrobia bacterium]|nr:hypothetical protein [Verrucomicrobiota bacterium]
MSDTFYSAVIAAGNRIFVPTHGIIPHGPIRTIRPVASLGLGDRNELITLIKERIAAGNPPAAHDDESPMADAMKIVDARSGKQFAERIRYWRMMRDAHGWTLSPTMLNKSGGVVDDKERTQKLPATATVDEVAEAFVNMVMAQVHEGPLGAAKK